MTTLDSQDWVRTGWLEPSRCPCDLTKRILVYGILYYINSILVLSIIYILKKELLYKVSQVSRQQATLSDLTCAQRTIDQYSSTHNTCLGMGDDSFRSKAMAMYKATGRSATKKVSRPRLHKNQPQKTAAVVLSCPGCGMHAFTIYRVNPLAQAAGSIRKTLGGEDTKKIEKVPAPVPTVSAAAAATQWHSLPSSLPPPPPLSATLPQFPPRASACPPAHTDNSSHPFLPPSPSPPSAGMSSDGGVLDAG